MQFFGKMKDKMAPALSDASQKLKESVDQVVAGAGEKIHESKLKNQLKALQKERADRIQALGDKAYALHKGDGIGPEDLAAELTAVDDVESRITAKQDEIDALASGAHLDYSVDPEGEAAPAVPDDQSSAE